MYKFSPWNILLFYFVWIGLTSFFWFTVLFANTIDFEVPTLFQNIFTLFVVFVCYSSLPKFPVNLKHLFVCNTDWPVEGHAKPKSFKSFFFFCHHNKIVLLILLYWYLSSALQVPFYFVIIVSYMSVPTQMFKVLEIFMLTLPLLCCYLIVYNVRTVVC